MKFLTVIIMLFLPFTAFSQIEGVVLDKETKKPIPYVNIWLEDEDAGTTSNAEGILEFNDSCLTKKIILTSIGYKKEIVELSSQYLKIFMTPENYSIDEVRITPKNNKETVIGHYEKSHAGYTFPDGPRIHARLIKKDLGYNYCTYIKSLKFKTFYHALLQLPVV
ncbi:MAG TPA: carboxypeptidase-like regulatory domain-containing protein [Bacteroidales bacterium]|nr:carboxypeptidase-like regulatory domain-containing protein [Bacteroidales bacterium]